MSQAAEGLKEQLYQHYYALTKNAANFLRSPEKQAEADTIMKQIEAINASQAPPAAAPAAPVSKKEFILMKLWEAFVAAKQNPLFPAEYKKKMLADIQAAYSKENPGVDLEETYMQLIGKKSGGRRRKAKKTRKNRA